MSDWENLIFYAANSEHSRIVDFRVIYYNYKPKDFAKLLDYIYRQEAIEEAVRLDNPEGKGNANK